MCWLKYRLPSDYKILNTVYKMYFDEFINYDASKDKRTSKNLIPIDCEKLSRKLNTNPEIIFGRLYYYLADKYQYTNKDGSHVSLFIAFAPPEKHCVHFSYLTSILAEIKHERIQFITNSSIAAVSAFIASISALLAILQTL